MKKIIILFILICSIAVAGDITFRNYAIFDKDDAVKNLEKATAYLAKINSKYPKKHKFSPKVFPYWDTAPYQVICDQLDAEGIITNTVETGVYVVRIKPSVKDKIDVVDYTNKWEHFVSSSLQELYPTNVTWRIERD